MLQTLFPKIKKDESGQGLVEYALVLPIFLMIVFFIIDYSTILYEKVAFNMALRDSIFEIDIDGQDAKKLQNYLNPYGGNVNRYGVGFDPYTNQIQNRGKDFYMDEPFLNGMTVAEYLKTEMKKRNASINIDNISFEKYDEERESKVGIYSGLQHYHYKKNYGANGRDFDSDPNFSTIFIAQMRVNYKIEPKGAFMKSMYPDGLNHEKVVYKASRNMRWRPKVVNPDIVDELDALKSHRREGRGGGQ